MKKLWAMVPALLAAVALGVTAGPAPASGELEFRARLTGFQETPSISTTGHGEFAARITSAGIEYVLQYDDLEGTAQVAHIHFGRRDVAGGISAFLCGGDDKPSCPASGTVTGTIDAADVIGPSTQGITAGELDELIAAMRHGATYVNVHSSTFGGGEIRGQVDPGFQQG